MHKDKEQQQFETMMDGPRMILNFIRMASATVGDWLRPWLIKSGTQGARAYNQYMLFSLAWIEVYGVGVCQQQPEFMWAFHGLAGLTLFRLFQHGYWRRWYDRQGQHTHSQYDGDPIWREGWADHMRLKTWCDPVLVFVIAGLCWLVFPPLGAMIGISGVGLVVTRGLSFHEDKARLRDMRDAQFDAGYYANQVKQ